MKTAMKKKIVLSIVLLNFVCIMYGQEKFKPFQPPVSYEQADKRADTVLKKMSIEEKIQLINGYNDFYIRGFKKYNMPEIYFSDATQGVRLQKSGNFIEKTTAFPCPLMLTATWNPELSREYAKSIGEECRAGNIGFLLGPGNNRYRISQCGRNFEYFGEDPFLASRMVESYVTGMQSTGTIATLKHFCCNNTDYNRRNSNSIVDERALHEIYLPSFKAGIEAGAMAVMTAYNQVNGEWAGQSNYVINRLLRKELGFKWLVMTDWESVYDAEKIIKSGQDLEMPGGDGYISKDALRLYKEGKVKEADIDRMAKSIIRTCIAMGFYDKKIKDDKFLQTYPEHEKTALQTAREGIVLLRNENNILPLSKVKIQNSKFKILLTGDYAEEVAHGGGSGEVKGYNTVSMLQALKDEFGNKIEYIKEPTDEQVKSADVVLLSIGTFDCEGRDRAFALPEDKEKKVIDISKLNRNVIVIVNSGSGIKMSGWNEKVKAILYSWYPGQNGNIALAEIISGKTNPSGKLPISIEKKFEDSPGYPYIPEGEKLYNGPANRTPLIDPVYDINYKEGIFIGYRWYEFKKIEPLYHFGFGLSFTSFEYGKLKMSSTDLKKGEDLVVEFTVKNTGKVAGYEVAQLYVQSVKSSVDRPIKELKGFRKVYLEPEETKTVKIILNDNDFAYWDVKSGNWLIEAGEYNILAGSASNDIRQSAKVMLTSNK